MKHRYQSIAQAPARLRDDPNYPGVPQSPNGAMLTKTQHRATVDYDTYVLRYAAAQRGNTLLVVAGITLAVAAAVFLSDAALVLAIMAGLGSAAAGSVGLLTAASAHAQYREMAVGVTETYTQPRPPKDATVRPFVASRDNDGRTTNTGRLQFAPQVWQALFDLALAGGGAIDRDNVAKRAGVGRRWYHTDPNSADGYRAFLAELRQLRFIDKRNRLTDMALRWYQEQIALPLAALPLRSRPDRPTGDRPRATEDDPAGWGE